MTRLKKLAALLTIVVAMGGAGPTAQAQSTVVEPAVAVERVAALGSPNVRSGPLADQREWTYLAARR